MPLWCTNSATIIICWILLSHTLFPSQPACVWGLLWVAVSRLISILFYHQKSSTLHFNLSKHLENIQYAFTGGKQNYEVEIKKRTWSIIFLNPFPEAIVSLVQKVLLTSKSKQEITPDYSPEFCGNMVHAKIRPEWINQSYKPSIGGLLGFVVGKLNTSASIHRLIVFEIDQ